MQKDDIPHIPVLLEPVLKSFQSIETGVIVDCTLGYGGHTQALLDAKPDVRVAGIDRDQTAIDFATNRLREYEERFKAFKGDFASSFKAVVNEYKAESIRGVLADIGVSSLQLDQEERGFGFQSDVLDMRMDQSKPLTAYEVVNHYSLEALTKIFKEYGEIPYAYHLAQKIITARQEAPIESAKALAHLAQSFSSKKKIHPATLMFQAIRIEVNDELGQLKGVLDAIEAAQLHDCYISIISFHSLEDRIVKQRFKTWATRCICAHDAMRCTCGAHHEKGKIIYKKPLTADSEEIKENPRSRSAKLRTFWFK